MIKTSIELLAEPIGFDIANSDDIVQANLLNGLGRGFKTYNDTNKHQQICYLTQKLTVETKELIALLYDYTKEDK